MSSHGALSKRTLILVHLVSGPQTRISLAKALGFKAPIGISREVNLLIADGKIKEDDIFQCPHCSEPIEGVPLLKAGKLLRLTDSGITESLEGRKLLQAILGDNAPGRGE